MASRVVTSPRTDRLDRRGGRRPVTSRSEIEHIALDLFGNRGFDTTTEAGWDRTAPAGLPDS